MQRAALVRETLIKLELSKLAPELLLFVLLNNRKALYFYSDPIYEWGVKGLHGNSKAK